MPTDSHTIPSHWSYDDIEPTTEGDPVITPSHLDLSSATIETGRRKPKAKRIYIQWGSSNNRLQVKATRKEKPMELSLDGSYIISWEEGIRKDLVIDGRYIRELLKQQGLITPEEANE